MDEAKSKLTNPGVVMAYYGSGRSLSRSPIVVTTYERRASEYQRQKSNDPDFCSPCEAIRWWRVIYDELHMLRTNSKKHQCCEVIDRRKQMACYR